MNDDSLIKARTFDRTIEELENYNAAELRNYIRHIRARYRDRNYLDDATRENLKVISLIKGSISNISDINYADLSMLEFEQAYVEYLRNSWKESKRFFEDSKNSAQLAGDRVRALIGEFSIIRVSIYAERLEPRVAYNCLAELLQEFANEQAENPSNPLFISWISNAHKRLLETSVDLGEAEKARFHFEHFAKSRRNQLSETISDERRIEVTQLLLSLEAKCEYVEGNYDASLEKFCRYLNVDLQFWGRADKKMSSKTDNLQEVAADYLYAGLSAAALGRQEEARAAWKRALELNRDNANLYFQKRILANLNPSIDPL